MVQLADNLQAWLRGDDTIESLAGGVAVARLCEAARQLHFERRG